MTKREFFQTVADSDLSSEMIEKAKNFLVQLDKEHSREKKPSKTALTNIPIKSAIVDLLTRDGAKIASEISLALSTDESTVSVPKVAALCRQLILDGTLVAEDVDAENGRRIKLYSIAD